MRDSAVVKQKDYCRSDVGSNPGYNFFLPKIPEGCCRMRCGGFCSCCRNVPAPGAGDWSSRRGFGLQAALRPGPVPGLTAVHYMYLHIRSGGIATSPFPFLCWFQPRHHIACRDAQSPSLQKVEIPHQNLKWDLLISQRRLTNRRQVRVV